MTRMAALCDLRPPGTSPKCFTHDGSTPAQRMQGYFRSACLISE